MVMNTSGQKLGDMIEIRNLKSINSVNDEYIFDLWIEGGLNPDGSIRSDMTKRDLRVTENSFPDFGEFDRLEDIQIDALNDFCAGLVEIIRSFA